MSNLDCSLVANIVQCVHAATWNELIAIIMVGMLVIIAMCVVIAAVEMLTARVVLCFIAAAACIWLFLSTK